MATSKDPSRSIVFFTDNEKGVSPLVHALTQEHFTVRIHPGSAQQLDRAITHGQDLLIVDSSDFSLENLTMYPRIRAIYTGLLILLIDNIDDMLKVLLYEQGVDELLIKPVHHLLMLARIRALLRRSGSKSTPAHLCFNGLEINGGLRRASYLGEEILFTSREFDLLWHLAKNACTTLDRDNLYKAVFGIEYNGYDRSIDMYVARLRSKMAPYPNLPQMIKTVRGSGYLFAAEH